MFEFDIERENKIIEYMSKATGVQYSDEQLKILKHRGGMCILASAGSGKTTILNHLIAKRIQTGEIADPSKLLCTTFSKGGADEMGQRLETLLKSLGVRGNVKVRTLHAVYNQLIKDLGYSLDILENSTKMRYIRECCKELEIKLEDDDYVTLEGILGFQINNLYSDEALFKSYAYTLRDQIPLEKYSQLRSLFSQKKQANSCMDFDDMQLMVYSLLKSPQYGSSIVAYCHSLWEYIYVDEAQDTSRIQFEILKMLVSDPNKLVFIGDDDQCLVAGTKISTDTGIKNIEDIRVGDRVLSAIGDGRTKYSVVDHIFTKPVSDKIVVIKTSGGKTIKGTPDHVGFARMPSNKEGNMVYLMYRSDIGFRIGNTCGVKCRKSRDTINAIDVVMLHEKADRVWVIGDYSTAQEAKYFEAYYSYKYGVPSYDYETHNRGSYFGILTTANISRLHKDLDTYNNGIKLLNDLGMNFDYPHRFPLGDEARNASYTLFGCDNPKGCGVNKSEVIVSEPSEKYIDIIRKRFIRSGGKFVTQQSIFNAVSRSFDSGELEKVVESIREDYKSFGININIRKEARLTSESFLFTPFGNMIPGMIVPVYNQTTGHMSEEEVVAVYYETYDGLVYDLSVPETRNFVADGIDVHNCIYQWRGADHSIILNICGIYTDLTMLTLTTNYRCKSEIVDRAAYGITFNKIRSDKTMRAHQPGGVIKVCDCGNSDFFDYSKYAYKYIKELVIDKGVLPSDIAVLSRNNNHLVILNNMLFKDGIFCKSPNEMKFTKCSAYRMIEGILQMGQNTTNGNVVGGNLWKCVTFMSRALSTEIGKMQSNYGVSLKDIIGMLLQSGGNTNVIWNNPGIRIGQMDNSKLRNIYYRLQYQSIQELELIFKILENETTDKAIHSLLWMFLKARVNYMFKSEDASRFMNGYVRYMMELMNTLGVSGAVKYLKDVERYESGGMAVMSPMVTLATMHGAKGKEWKYVIMFADDNISFPDFSNIRGCIEDGIPESDIRCMIDENRRLHYVAMTRAKENLTIFTDSNNMSIYTYEALGCISNTGNRDSNSDIITMAQHGMDNRLTSIGNQVVFNSDSPYYMSVNTEDLSTDAEKHYKEMKSEETETGRQVDTGFNINSIQTYAPAQLGE